MSDVAKAAPKGAVAAKPPQLPARPRAHRADQEFLPAAIEILERPPSPVAVWLMGGIAAFAVVALAWAYFGRIDVVAIAQGKIQPTGRIKVIQPLDTGKVVALMAENGRHVAAGDVLAELDSADASADANAALAAVVSYRAEALRRRAAIEAAGAGVFAPPRIDWEQGPDRPAIPPRARQREERVLAGDLGQAGATVASLRAQKAQKRAEADSLVETMAAENRLIDVLLQRVATRDSLVGSGSGTKSAVIDARELLETQKTQLMNQKGQFNAAMAAAEVTEREIAKTLGTFVADNAQKLSDAERQGDEYEQRLAKARAKVSHMTLVSPISGTVQASTLTTIGQVVTTSEELMRIVPDNVSLEIEAYLPNKDIGFVKVGQEAVVKIESFPFTRYGTIVAKVAKVAADAIPEPDATTAEGNPAKAQRSGGFSGAQRTQNLVFPITLTMDRSEIVVDGVPVTLSAGMAVAVEVQTGSRRILEFVFSPLVAVGSEAMHER